MRNLRASSLKAFEAAARYMSFKLAAEELHVTATAISHQIKSLEQQLDCRLFIRKPRQVQLTDEGKELFTTLKRAFDDVDEVASRVKSRRSREVVTLGLGPIIGTRWLAPRLGAFWNQHPDIDLRLHHTNFPMQQSSDQFDLAIAWGDGHWPGMEVIPFISIEVTPVVAPGILQPLQATDLLTRPLIHQRDRQGWQQWFQAAGIERIDDDIGTVIDDANLVLQTVLDGQGIALGILPFIEADLASGRLLRPFELAVDPGKAYYLIYRKSRLDKQAVNSVRRWLSAQI
jgi:LysR family glycine cleavage system transcriptional activator